MSVRLLAHARRRRSERVFAQPSKLDAALRKQARHRREYEQQIKAALTDVFYPEPKGVVN